MPWTVTEIFRGSTILILHVESDAAGDIELVVTHGLRHVPVHIGIMPHNALANAAGFWVDDIDETQVHLHKPNGGAGAFVHLTLWTLRTLPWEADFEEIQDPT